MPAQPPIRQTASPQSDTRRIVLPEPDRRVTASPQRAIAASISSRLATRMRERHLDALRVTGIWGFADLGSPPGRRYIAYDGIEIACSAGRLSLRCLVQGRPVDAPALTLDQPLYQDLIIRHADALYPALASARRRARRRPKLPAELQMVVNHLGAYELRSAAPDEEPGRPASDAAADVSALLLAGMRDLRIGALGARGTWGVVDAGDTDGPHYVAYDALDFRASHPSSLQLINDGAPCLDRKLTSDDPAFRELVLQHAPALIGALAIARAEHRRQRLHREAGAQG